MRLATIAVSLGLSAAIGAASGAALAQASALPHSGWSFDFTPYLWGAAMEGSVGAGELPTINIDMSFSDILDHLDAGLMGAFEARKGRWGILLDAKAGYRYIDVDYDKDNFAFDMAYSGLYFGLGIRF